MALPNEPTTLSLRALEQQNSKPESLKSVISRINNQRGYFRHITEASLEKEIVEQQENGSHAHGVDVETSTKDDAAQQREEAVKARTNINKSINQAFQDSFMALDFISVLLSKDTPRQAELSMSALVKERVPAGSLGTTKVSTPYVAPSESVRTPFVTAGWKSQSLQSSANALLSASASLSTEVNLESRYWTSLLSITAAGWAVSRYPGHSRVISPLLAVRYGFPDSAPSFRDKGIAALRRSEDGNAFLDSGALDTNSPRAIYVRVFEPNSDMIAGESVVPSLVLPEAPLDEQVRQARDVLFAEELYYEIVREARGLAKWGCTIRDKEVEIPFASFTVKVSLQPLPTSPTAYTPSNSRARSLAQAMAITLQLLLTHEHRKTLAERSKVPSPISEDGSERKPSYQLLRPIIVHLRHFSTFHALRSHFQTIQSCLSSASIPLAVTTTKETTHLSSASISTAASAALLSKLSSPLSTTLGIILPNTDKLSIGLTTNSAWGGESFVVTLSHNISTTTSSHSQNSPANVEEKTTEQRFTTPELTFPYISHLVTKAITSYITSLPAGLGNASTLRWALTAAPDELELYMPSADKTKRLRISIEEGVGGVEWGFVGGEADGIMSVTWRPKRAGDAEYVPSFEEVLKIAGRDDMKFLQGDEEGSLTWQAIRFMDG
ncbi:MAG: RNA polymerase II mediator complex subunit [Vezdaea aestivalis]|nr:MAG: RNA polymerase II mediator complex subunit [Vezdaea aestivalis]